MSASPKTCPCCGLTVPPAENPFVSAPVKRRIYDLLRLHREGLTREQLMERIYDGPDGGPENYGVIAVHVWEMNQRLAKTGFRIAAASRGWSSPYSLRSTTSPAGATGS